MCSGVVPPSALSAASIGVAGGEEGGRERPGDADAGRLEEIVVGLVNVHERRIGLIGGRQAIGPNPLGHRDRIGAVQVGLPDSRAHVPPIDLAVERVYVQRAVRIVPPTRARITDVLDARAIQVGPLDTIRRQPIDPVVKHVEGRGVGMIQPGDQRLDVATVQVAAVDLARIALRPVEFAHDGIDNQVVAPHPGGPGGDHDLDVRAVQVGPVNGIVLLGPIELGRSRLARYGINADGAFGSGDSDDAFDLRPIQVGAAYQAVGADPIDLAPLPINGQVPGVAGRDDGFRRGPAPGIVQVDAHNGLGVIIGEIEKIGHVARGYGGGRGGDGGLGGRAVGHPVKVHVLGAGAGAQEAFLVIGKPVPI